MSALHLRDGGRFERMLASVSWHEIERDGDFVLMEQRPCRYMRGWWHEHNDGSDFGGHPADYDRERKAYFCRTCGAAQTRPVPLPRGNGKGKP